MWFVVVAMAVAVVICLVVAAVVVVVVVVVGQCYPDKAVQREVLSLLVYCCYQVHGCTWQGPLKEWQVCIRINDPIHSNNRIINSN